MAKHWEKRNKLRVILMLGWNKNQHGSSGHSSCFSCYSWHNSIAFYVLQLQQKNRYPILQKIPYFSYFLLVIILFMFFFSKIGSYSVAQANLKDIILSRLVSDSQQSSCISLLSARIANIPYHTPLIPYMKPWDSKRNLKLFV